MANYVSYRDGGKTSEAGLLTPFFALFRPGYATGWAASQRGAGANMSVDVAVGVGNIALTTDSYGYLSWSDAVNNVVISASDPTNPRKDIVVAYIDKSVVSSASNDNPGALKFAAVAGTPAGSPADPSNATIQAAVGSGNPWISLARVAVAASAASIVTANITDIRVPMAYKVPYLYGGASNTNGHSVPNIADDTVALLAAAQTLSNKTFTAPVLTSPAISGTPTITGWDGWQALSNTPNTVAQAGSRFYTLTFNSVDLTGSISPGMKMRLTRTVAAPTKCTDLESGSTQYYSKSSPNKLTFTDDFVCSAWIKVESYGVAGIVSRYNGTSGFLLQLDSVGRIQLSGFNAGAANFSQVLSAASVPLGKWVHITAQLDMSTFTATTTTSYIMIDGIDVPASVSRGGTNPTALVQAGSLEVGSWNAGTSTFDGKLAQVAVFNAKVTQATIQTYYTQGLAGTETSLASAYSFNNSIADLNTTTPNDLTANNSAVATATDSPFALGATAGTLEYAKVISSTFSTNTTVVVQVADGCAIPQSGGVSAVAISASDNPLNWPGFNPVLLNVLNMGSPTTTSATPAQITGHTLTLTLPPNITYRLRLYSEWVSNSSTAQINVLSIWDGVVNSGQSLARASNGGSNTANHGSQLQCETMPLNSGAGGSKTFNAGMHTSSGTATLTSNATSPSFFEVEILDW